MGVRNRESQVSEATEAVHLREKEEKKKDEISK
jgi:hypothetical protein